MLISTDIVWGMTDTAIFFFFFFFFFFFWWRVWLIYHIFVRGKHLMLGPSLCSRLNSDGLGEQTGVLSERQIYGDMQRQMISDKSAKLRNICPDESIHKAHIGKSKTIIFINFHTALNYLVLVY